MISKENVRKFQVAQKITDSLKSGSEFSALSLEDKQEALENWKRLYKELTGRSFEEDTEGKRDEEQNR